MEAIIIKGKSNTGKTGICHELIGIRPIIDDFNKRKYKNKICVVNINGKNCVIDSEGDNEGSIDNGIRYTKELIGKKIKIDVIILTVRTNYTKDLFQLAINSLNEIEKNMKCTTVTTVQLTDENDSISKEYARQADNIKKII